MAAVPVLEILPGLRVVASPEALDAVPWEARAVVLRFAPDDAFAIGVTDIDVNDAHAIVAEETGFVGVWLTVDEFTEQVIPHVEWPLPEARPALGQGFIAGVPAKLWLTADRALLLCAGSYAHELAERLR